MCETLREPVKVLKSLSEKTTNKEYKFKRLYRNLYNPEFYFLAYKNISQSQGSMTLGVDGKSLDGMSEKRINALIESLKDFSYQPNPARRVYIEKKNSTKKRPLGIPSTEDKLVQEVVKMILESIYEPNFSDYSHGFRPNRSCHSALQQIQNQFTGITWFVEGDIHACFDSFDHHVLVNILRERIEDENFLALIWKMLKAGYMEQWVYNCTFSGTPQGSGVSPMLANIYLSKLDEFAERLKKEFSKGKSKDNLEYSRAASKLYYIRRRNRANWDSWNEQQRKEALRLQKICKEGVDAIGAALRELEAAGYIVRHKLRDRQGRISDTEYVIYEQPQLRKPDTDSPDTENPYMDKPDTEKPAELNIEKSNTQKQNIYGSSTDSIPFRDCAADCLPERKGRDAMSLTEIESYRELIQENIGYEYLCQQYETYREDLDEIVELIVETVCAKRKTTRIAGSDFPHEIVRSRFLKLDNSHIEFVMDCLQKNTTEIRNMKQYLLTVLFNAPTTISNHYTSQVNHDLYGGW